ncbi:MAG TPA: hypothetical protein PKE69_08275 [Pyrinomonadaceae bacterium]|nr:hypothetical protein [Pyrinomonadaceae bacterium]
MTLSEKSWKIILVAIGLIYVLLRFWDLTDSCLWFDEIFSVHAATHSWNDLFGFVAQDLIHPPFFYVLLKLWIAVGGESLFWLRAFPVFFSCLALIPFYRLCRRLKLSYPSIAVALLIFAVNGCLIKYAQEVRMYSVLLCLSLFSMWLFVRYLDLGKSFWILTVVNIFLVHTHYFGWFVVLSEVAAICVLQRIKIGQILIMFGINLAVFAPWAWTVFRVSETNSGLAQNIGWMAKPNLVSIFQFAFDLVEPFYFQASSIDWQSNYLISVPILLVIVALQIIFITNWKSKDETAKRDFILLLIFIKLPCLLAFVASWILPQSIWGTRHLIIVFAPLTILITFFIETIEIKTLKIALVSAIMVFIGIAFVLKIVKPQPKFIWCAWENLAQNLDKNQANKIYVFEDLSAYHFWFALRESDNFKVLTVKNIDGLKEDTAYFLPRGFDGVQSAKIEEITDNKFYIAFQAKDWQEKEPPLRNFAVKGYKINEPKIIEAQGIKAFLVLVEK